MRPKLNSTVSVVKLNDQILEFFKTNTRQQVRIKVQDDAILQLVTSLDGEKEIDQIAKEQNIDPSELKVLLDFLQGKGILDNVEPKSDFFTTKNIEELYISSLSTLYLMSICLKCGRTLILQPL